MSCYVSRSTKALRTSSDVQVQRMPVYYSGAFLQQCFSVHPLTLNLKVMERLDQVDISCLSCRLKHRIVATAVVHEPADERRTSRSALEKLVRCAEGHPSEVRVSNVDVMRDNMALRCRECRKTYRLTVARFETHQKDR